MTVSDTVLNRDFPTYFRGNASRHHIDFEHVTFFNHEYYDLGSALSETDRMHFICSIAALFDRTFLLLSQYKPNCKPVFQCESYSIDTEKNLVMDLLYMTVICLLTVR